MHTSHTVKDCVFVYLFVLKSMKRFFKNPLKVLHWPCYPSGFQGEPFEKLKKPSFIYLIHYYPLYPWNTGWIRAGTPWMECQATGHKKERVELHTSLGSNPGPCRPQTLPVVLLTTSPYISVPWYDAQLTFLSVCNIWPGLYQDFL